MRILFLSMIILFSTSCFLEKKTITELDKFVLNFREYDPTIIRIYPSIYYDTNNGPVHYFAYKNIKKPIQISLKDISERNVVYLSRPASYFPTFIDLSGYHRIFTEAGTAAYSSQSTKIISISVGATTTGNGTGMEEYVGQCLTYVLILPVEGFYLKYPNLFCINE